MRWDINTRHHDFACASTEHIVELFSLSDEEKREVFKAVYQRIRAMLTVYDLQRDGLQRRLHPMEN